ncbi:SUKH-3 domain-containing protein [Streptomyces sp. NPDC056411]|uniref:SUKH-3 domain-containing protein n=1 Tax=Streptomyces sp. NPDC056411 TaxID=3345813 RepID=UPI0035E207E1
MLAEMSREEILQWLTENGWSPERQVGERCAEFISAAVEDSVGEGFPVTPFETAESFLASFGLLTLAHPTDSESRLVINPTGGYEGDFGEIAELSEELNRRLFRVGYDLPDGGIMLVAEDGGFYCLHHAGSFSLGNGAYEFFRNWVRGDLRSV